MTHRRGVRATLVIVTCPTDEEVAGVNTWVRRTGVAVWGQIRGAPLTTAWLVVLLVTTFIQHRLSPPRLEVVLSDRSTNIANLSTDPLRVLVSSLFWIDGEFWLPYLILFCLFHRPAEQWLGSARWFIVGFSAHVGATYISEGALRAAIRAGIAAPAMVDVLDIGVSYFLAAIVGILTYRIVTPWRWVYLAGVVIVYAVPLFTAITFTGVGHATSVLIGLAWYPITRARPGPQWNPMDTLHRARRRLGSLRSTSETR